MCLCRDVIYWFCLVGSLCSERHKSGLHYTIKGPLMQHAREHDGFSGDQQSFEGKQHSVSLKAACPSWLCKSSTESVKNEPGYCRKIFGFRSFTQLSITFYFLFQNVSQMMILLTNPPTTNARGPPLWITRLQRLQPSVTEADSHRVEWWREQLVQSCPTQSPTCCGVEGGHNHPPSNGAFGLLTL